MPNILVVYYYTRPHPPRASIRDHLDSFQRYSSHRCYYFNAALADRPWWTHAVDFDLVIFHTTLLGVRWNRPRFARLMDRLDWLGRLPAVKAMIPQDEYLSTDQLCQFIDRMNVSQVFSTASLADWPAIYPGLATRNVQFSQVLTGYLDDRTLTRIAALTARSPLRPVDIGYRAWDVPAWLGRHGRLKTRIARHVAARCRNTALTTDISTRPEDVLLGDQWYRFLLRCRYTIGVEGGASLLDRDGSLRERSERYLADHPHASFEQIEAACFAGRDDSLGLFVLSPRHLEACATRTCQILVSGQYNGVLQPGRHYLELKPDFSNLDDVLAQLGDPRLRQELTERAYEEVVASGRFSYRRFVEFVFQRALGVGCEAQPAVQPLGQRAAWACARQADRLSWNALALAAWGWQGLSRIGRVNDFRRTPGARSVSPPARVSVHS
jgi:hypothetical protein